MKLRLSTLFLIICIGIACKSNKAVIEEDEKVAFNNKVLVTMKDGTTADELVEKYVEYSLTFKGRTSKGTRTVMFQFDDTKISHKNMLALLNKDRKIASAQSMKSPANKSKPGRSAFKADPVTPKQ